MMQEIVEVLLNELATDSVKELSYYLGKWIYLIDALDDFDKDKKKNNFNVFINAHNEINTKKELIEKNGQELIIVFASVVNKISELASKLDYQFNHDLTDNVLFRGIIAQTKRIMENQKCKNTSKF